MENTKNGATRRNYAGSSSSRATDEFATANSFPGLEDKVNRSSRRKNSISLLQVLFSLSTVLILVRSLFRRIQIMDLILKIDSLWPL